VVASPSVLCDKMHQLASGLPSRTHDDSIGRGVKSTVSLAISINERDIQTLKEKWRAKSFEQPPENSPVKLVGLI
jgi:hypothetical protein